MPKFNMKEEELKTEQDKWLFALKNLDKFEKIPLSLNSKKQFIKFFDAAAVVNLNRQEMNAYQQSLKVQRDNYAVRQAAIKEGHAEGKRQGELEGKREEKFATAREMKLKGLDIDLISEITKLSKAEIDTI